MNGSRNAKTYFTISLLIAIVATAVAFALFFVSGEDGIYRKISATQNSGNDIPPAADVPASAEFKKTYRKNLEIL